MRCVSAELLPAALSCCCAVVLCWVALRCHEVGWHWLACWLLCCGVLFLAPVC
jgi:hypothetical protein